MPRGSRPGERRGGRQKGTPNKRTAWRNAAIAADPNVSPLDFLLAITREQNLPLETRVNAAHEALPYVHSRIRDTTPNQPHMTTHGAPIYSVNVKNGSDPNDSKMEVGDGETDKGNSGHEDIGDNRGEAKNRATGASDGLADGQDASPLAFLLGVLRDVDTPAHLRLKVASITAPYVHPKQKAPHRESEALSGFNIDLAAAKALRDDELRYMDVRGDPENDDVGVRIAATKSNLTYPAGYGTKEVNKDSRRLGELSDKHRSRVKLTQKEDAEQAILNARVAAFKGTPEAEKWALDRERIWRLTYKMKYEPEALTDEEQTELANLRALYPDLSREPDNYGDRVMFAFFAKLSATYSRRESAQNGPG
jgi:hypothetical protein